jgi:hypothetical protein
VKAAPVLLELGPGKGGGGGWCQVGYGEHAGMGSAFSPARAKTGKSIYASIVIISITTSNSINLKARRPSFGIRFMASSRPDGSIPPSCAIIIVALQFHYTLFYEILNIMVCAFCALDLRQAKNVAGIAFNFQNESGYALVAGGKSYVAFFKTTSTRRTTRGLSRVYS